MAFEPRFVSCEGTLPHYLGLQNAAATATAVAIMAVPMMKVHRAFSENRSHSLKIHTLCMLLLFGANIYTHAKGIGEPFDRFPSWYGISGAYCLWRGDAPGLAPLLVVWFLIQITLMHNFSWATEQQVYLPIEGITSLYVIFTMGRRSWSTPRLRKQFLSCLALFGAVQAAVTLEPKVCNGPVLVKRFFHAVVDHGTVSMFFHQVTSLTFDLLGGTTTSKIHP